MRSQTSQQEIKMNINDCRMAWEAHAPQFARRGFIAPEVRMYYPDGAKEDWNIALDAQPALMSDPNSALPAMLTTMIDPEIVPFVFAPLEFGDICGEVRKGTWLDEMILFPTVEHTGEVAPYGDDANSGAAAINMNWPPRQSYLFQIVKQYGERALQRAGLGKIDYVSEIDKAAADIVNRFHNLAYAFGISGLICYGMLNDPSLTASLTPGIKANGNGNVWIFGNLPNATANEVYNDILALYQKLIQQTFGLVNKKSKLTLAMSPGSEMAMDFANGFNVHTSDLLEKAFPNLTIKTAPQYGVLSGTNPQGIAGGNFVQLFAEEFEGIKTTMAVYNEKQRAFPIIKEMSSFKQKIASGVFGTVIRRPLAIANMLGI